MWLLPHWGLASFNVLAAVLDKHVNLLFGMVQHLWKDSLLVAASQMDVGLLPRVVHRLYQGMQELQQQAAQVSFHHYNFYLQLPTAQMAVIRLLTGVAQHLLAATNPQSQPARNKCLDVCPPGC